MAFIIRVCDLFTVVICKCGMGGAGGLLPCCAKFLTSEEFFFIFIFFYFFLFFTVGDRHLVVLWRCSFYYL